MTQERRSAALLTDGGGQEMHTTVIELVKPSRLVARA